MGLGDSLYLQAVTRYLVSKGERLEVCSEWPDVFRPLGDAVRIAPFSRQNIQILAHYSLRKSRPETDQFQDCCISAKVTEPVDLRLDWTITDQRFVDAVKAQANGWPIVCVQLPRTPMNRVDGFGKELLPDCRVIQRQIDRIRDRAFLVQIGAGTPVHRFDGLHLDLANKTTVAQLLDLASIAHGFIGYVSFIVPLAESLKKPALIVWSHLGLKASHAYVRQITPRKVIHGPHCKWAIDDWNQDRIDEAFNDFLRQGNGTASH